MCFFNYLQRADFLEPLLYVALPNSDYANLD